VNSWPWISDPAKCCGVIAQLSPSNTAALATGGGLVIGGDWDRHMYAYDALPERFSGRTRLITSAQGFPDYVSGEGKAST